MAAEIDAMGTCINALNELTPEERQRAIDWLYARVYDDLKKGVQAAYAVGLFLEEGSVA
jgi:hypothetical protein